MRLKQFNQVVSYFYWHNLHIIVCNFLLDFHFASITFLWLIVREVYFILTDELLRKSWDIAESRDIPLLAQYLEENIIIAGCIWMVQVFRVASRGRCGQAQLLLTCVVQTWSSPNAALYIYMGPSANQLIDQRRRLQFSLSLIPKPFFFCFLSTTLLFNG